MGWGVTSGYASSTLGAVEAPSVRLFWFVLLSVGHRCACELGAPEIGAVKIGVTKVGAAEIGILEFGPAAVGLRQVGAAGGRTAEGGAG